MRLLYDHLRVVVDVFHGLLQGRAFFKSDVVSDLERRVAEDEKFHELPQRFLTHLVGTSYLLRLLSSERLIHLVHLRVSLEQFKVYALHHAYHGDDPGATADGKDLAILPQ